MAPALKTLAAGIFLLATGAAATAAPPHLGGAPSGVRSSLILVHGNHRTCQRDRRGWHRHNRYGERRRCRRWHGRGRRPDACVKFGPFWYCDY